MNRVQNLKKWLGRTLVEWGIFGSLGPRKRRLQRILGNLRPRLTEHELIRCGLGDDGAYLIPDISLNSSAVFSPGVGSSITFEKQFLQRGIPCYLLDGTVAAPPESHELIFFQSKNLSAKSSEDSLEMDDWVSQSGFSGDGKLLLQMDIEGAEWEILAAGRAQLSQFQTVVVELHWLGDLLRDREQISLVEKAVDCLTRDHVVVHIHQNNYRPQKKYRGVVFPDVLEVTLLRKDSVSGLGGPAPLPHPLDVPNNPRRPELGVPSVWA